MLASMCTLGPVAAAAVSVPILWSLGLNNWCQEWGKVVCDVLAGLRYHVEGAGAKK